MPKGLDYETFEKRADEEGLAWEEKEQFNKAINAYDRLLTEVEIFTTTSQPENNEKNAIIAYLLMRKAGVLLQTGKVELGSN